MVKSSKDVKGTDYSFSGTPSKYFKDIENSKIKPKLTAAKVEYGRLYKTDYFNIKTENIQAIYSGFPTTLKDTPVFRYSEYLLDLNKKGQK